MVSSTREWYQRETEREAAARIYTRVCNRNISLLPKKTSQSGQLNAYSVRFEQRRNGRMDRQTGGQTLLGFYRDAMAHVRTCVCESKGHQLSKGLITDQSGVSICKRFFDETINIRQYKVINFKTCTIFILSNFIYLPFFSEPLLRC